MELRADMKHWSTDVEKHRHRFTGSLGVQINPERATAVAGVLPMVPKG